MEITLSVLITMYIVMLGPVKLILPFVHATTNADAELRRTLALRSTLFSVGVALLCLLVGDWVVEKLVLSEGTLLIAISLFLAAFAYSLAHTGDPARGTDRPPPEEPAKELAIFPLSFPGVIPPQGFGLLVLSTQLEYPDSPIGGLPLVIVLTVIVMAINFLCMIGSGFILRVTGRVFWLVLARFLSPLLVALSVHLFLTGLEQTGFV